MRHLVLMTFVLVCGFQALAQSNTCSDATATDPQTGELRVLRPGYKVVSLTDIKKDDCMPISTVSIADGVCKFFGKTKVVSYTPDRNAKGVVKNFQTAAVIDFAGGFAGTEEMDADTTNNPAIGAIVCK